MEKHQINYIAVQFSRPFILKCKVKPGSLRLPQQGSLLQVAAAALLGLIKWVTTYHSRFSIS